MLASVGAKPVTVKPMPHALLTVAAPFVQIMRELRETLYQFTSPYVALPRGDALPQIHSLAPQSSDSRSALLAGNLRPTPHGLVAATVMIPTLARSLRSRTD